MRIFLLLLPVLVSCGGIPQISGIEAKPFSGKPPLSVEFALKSSGMVEKLVCQLDAEGDGSYEQKIENCTSQTRFNHTYTQVGNYKASLKVTNPNGSGTFYGIEIRVEGAPQIAAFVGSPSLGNAPLQATFSWQISDPNHDAFSCKLDADGDGTDEYTWPDCSNSSTQTHTYSLPGAYGARLLVVDGRGEESFKVVPITVQGTSCSSTQTLAGRLVGTSVTQPTYSKGQRLGRFAQQELRGLSRTSAAAVPGELLVLAGPDSTKQLQKEFGSRAVDVNWSLLWVEPGTEPAMASRLLAMGALYVQPNYRYKPLAVPSDSLYYLQRAQLNSLMGLECAWDIEQGKSAPVRVALLDDGADLDHPDLKNRWFLPQGLELDVAQNDSDPSHANTLGHGSLVAGVLGAEAGNQQGIVGANWGAQMVPIKIFTDADESTTSLIIKGISLARSASLDAQVINLSLCLVDDAKPQFCSTQTDGALEAALQAARAEGRIVVASGGNDGQGQVAYPAASTAAIAVGAIQNNRARASFSNYGSALDLVAPGVGLLTTNPSHRQTSSNGLYTQVQGTSFSAPLVSAAVALFMSRYKALKGQWPTPERVYTCLTISAEDLGSPGPDEQFGSGLVRIDRMLRGPTSDAYCFA